MANPKSLSLSRYLRQRVDAMEPTERALAMVEARMARSSLFNTDASKQIIHVSHKIANPAPLGLFGFGVTTALLQGAVTGISGAETASWAVAFAFGFGGTAQFIAGLIDFFRQNMFGGVSFCTYGAFWWSVAIYSTLTKMASSVDGKPLLAPSVDGEAFMLAAFGVLTLILACCTFAMNGVLVALFWTLALLFFFLCGGMYNHTMHQFAGWFGLVVAAIAVYAAAAELINDTYGRAILPIFSLNGKKEAVIAEEPLDILSVQRWYLEYSDSDDGTMGNKPRIGDSARGSSENDNNV